MPRNSIYFVLVFFVVLIAAGLVFWMRHQDILAWMHTNKAEYLFNLQRYGEALKEIQKAEDLNGSQQLKRRRLSLRISARRRENAATVAFAKEILSTSQDDAEALTGDAPRAAAIKRHLACRQNEAVHRIEFPQQVRIDRQAAYPVLESCHDPVVNEACPAGDCAVGLYQATRSALFSQGRQRGRCAEHKSVHSFSRW